MSGAGVGASTGGSPASGSPSQLEAARTPLTAGAGGGSSHANNNRGGWKRFVGPLIGLVATAGVALGLVLILDDRFASVLRPDKTLGAMQCGVYQVCIHIVTI